MFEPKYKVLNKEQSEILLKCIILDKDKGTSIITEEQEKDLSFLSKIAKLRIDVLKLPIKYTFFGLIAIDAFVDNAGGAIVLLHDFLEKKEGETITPSTLCEIYPSGFYTYESFVDLVDNYIKLGKTKWSKIY